MSESKDVHNVGRDGHGLHYYKGTKDVSGSIILYYFLNILRNISQYPK